MFKVSIIIPIYNVEKYIKECLDSIIGQTLKDIEIICVDDGSTDHSYEILEDFVQKDNRIKIIKKLNSGYGDSMNTGISQAQGEYIGIVESDDWVERNMFETLYKAAKEHNAEVVKSNFFDYYSTDSFRCKLREILPDKDYNQVFSPLERQGIFYSKPSIWSAIYKKEFLTENKINFLTTPGASYQDVSFNFKVWSYAKKVYLIKDAFVHYRLDNETSSVNSKEKAFYICDEYKEIEAFLDSNAEKKKHLEAIKNRSKYLTYLWNFERLSGVSKKQFLKQMSKEFKFSIKNKNVNKDLFSKREWDEYNLIAKCPTLFWFNHKIQSKT